MLHKILCNTHTQARTQRSELKPLQSVSHIMAVNGTHGFETGPLTLLIEKVDSVNGPFER